MHSMRYLTCLILIFLQFDISGQTAGGPDQFGYTWRNSLNPMGPLFNWIDIDSLPGTVTVNGLSDDNQAGPFPMEIQFQFYGSIPDSFYIGSNGYIGFTPSVLAHPFNLIPNPSSADFFIAGMACDLSFMDTSQTAIPGASCRYWINAAA